MSPRPVVVDLGGWTYGDESASTIVTLTDLDGNPVDLSNAADITFACQSVGGANTFSLACTVEGAATNGQVNIAGMATGAAEPARNGRVQYTARLSFNNDGVNTIYRADYRFWIERFPESDIVIQTLGTGVGIEAVRQLEDVFYTLPFGGQGVYDAGFADDNGSTTDTTNATGATITPQFMTHLVGGAAVSTADRALRNDPEWLNQDPFAAFNNTADHWWVYRTLCQVYMTWVQDNRNSEAVPATIHSSAAIQQGSWIGLSWGMPTSYTTLPGTNHTCFAIVYNLYTGHWETWVIDQFGPTNGKRFITDLGADAGIGLRPFTNGPAAYFLEIDYIPNNRVDFYINRGHDGSGGYGGGLVQSFTDEEFGSGYTPIANTYDNEAKVGATIKGCTLIATYANPSAEARIQWYGKRRITDRSYRP